MLNSEKRKVINEIINFLNKMDKFNNLTDIDDYLYEKISETTKHTKLKLEDIVELHKYPISHYIKNLWLLPVFKNYKIYEIIFWINNVKVINKKSKKESDFLHDIYMYQIENDFDKKKIYLEIILNKLINYIKYSNKDAKNK